MTLDAKQEFFLGEVGKDAPSKQAAFRRTFEGKCSPRAAIKAHCLECVWLELEAVWDCEATSCALWRFRPKRNRKEAQ